MNKRAPLIVAGIIFSIATLVHLLRLIYQWNIMVDGYIVPMSLSEGGLVVAAILAIWMFIAAR